MPDGNKIWDNTFAPEQVAACQSDPSHSHRWGYFLFLAGHSDKQHAALVETPSTGEDLLPATSQPAGLGLSPLERSASPSTRRMHQQMYTRP